MAKGNPIKYIATWGTFNVVGTEPWALTSGSTPDGLEFNMSDLPALSNSGDVEIVSQSNFAYHIVGIRGLTNSGSYRIALMQQPYGAIAFSEPPAWGMGFVNASGQFFFQNAFEYLANPGDFYFNRVTQTLYYYKRPTDNMATATVIAPVSPGLFVLAGTATNNRVQNISFSGITFSHDNWLLMNVAGSYASTTPQSTAMYDKYSSDGNWGEVEWRDTKVMQAAVLVENADNISFTGDIFQHLGSMALNLGNDARDCSVIGNVFRDLGSSAVNIGDPWNLHIGDGDFPPGVEGVPYNDLVKDNFIYQASLESKQAEPLTAYFTDTSEISHNEVYFAPYTGIRGGWGWSTINTSAQNLKINYNRVDDVMRQLADGGSIYTLGNSPNSQIRGNYCNRSGLNSIYPDAGSSYFEIASNVLCNYPHGVWLYVSTPTALIHDLNAHDNYADAINGSEGGYASNSIIINNSSAWSPVTTANALNAGLEPAYQSIRPADLYPPVGLGTVEAERCVLLGGAQIYSDPAASGGGAVQDIQNLGDGLRLGQTTAAVGRITIWYASLQSGTYGLYVNGIRIQDIAFASTGAWNGSYTSITVTLVSTIPAGSVIELRRDKNDAAWNLDKFVLGPLGPTLLINGDFGTGATQTGAAVLGSSNDFWNAISASTSAIANSAGNLVPGVGLTLSDQGVFTGVGGAAMDAATMPLMQDYAFGAASTTAVNVSLTGLTSYTNCPFNLVVYGAGDSGGQGATLSITAGASGGNTAGTLTTSATSRQLSAGAGIAYQTFTGIIAGGTLNFTASKNAGQSFVVENGFQLQVFLLPPVITTQPASHTNFVGNTVSFNVEVSGKAPLIYQWQATNSVTGGFTNLVNGGNVSGVTSNVLTISNVNSNWALAYQVIVTNSYGSATSGPAATLTVMAVTIPTNLIAIQNYSFEAQSVATNSYSIVTPTSWSVSGKSGGAVVAIIHPGTIDGRFGAGHVPAGMDGSNYCQLFMNNAIGSATVYQDLGSANQYQAGVTYTLTAAFGLEKGNFPTGALVFYNSSLVALASNIITSAMLTSNAFTSFSVAYTATGSEGGNGDIVVGFNTTGAAAGTSFDVDNVRLTPVTPVSSNAYLTSLALIPAGVLTPAFASNVLSYAATEAYGSIPTVTVADANVNATNRLIYNGTTNLLASGVASSPLALNANPAATNGVVLQVTAQDGVTVQTYTVNVTQLPNQSTQPMLTNSVSNGTLSLSWGLDRLGYRLLMQTNNLNQGVSITPGDWDTVSGSTTTNLMAIPIVTTNLDEYYRLVYP